MPDKEQRGAKQGRKDNGKGDGSEVHGSRSSRNGVSFFAALVVAPSAFFDGFNNIEDIVKRQKP